MLTLKYKRPTQKEHGHTDVYSDGEYIGYIMPDKIKGGWHYDGRGNYYPKTLHATNRKELLTGIVLAILQ